ncbi:MAG: hypothetical protein IJ272_01410 [Clostridia bacterium]|nr:hypothetical protein [Clostridia bacterium]
MALIRPCADLRNNYNEISKICHETKEAMYITKNGTNDLVVLSDEAYEELLKSNKETEDERIDRLVAKHFNEHYENFEEFQKAVFEKIDQAFRDIEQGHYTPMENAVAELEEKYGLSKS